MRQVFPGVGTLDDKRIMTENLAPGVRVYDEDLLNVGGSEWRTWNPMKSKLGAYIVKGGRTLPLKADSKVLYLGAANGTTPSHVSDIVRDGTLYAIEFSPRSFRDLLGMARHRPNVVPVLADAWRPELYERFIGKVDFLFQDIAQRQQAGIFAKNLNRFKPDWAMLAIKARSVDVAKDPRQVYDEVAAEVGELAGYGVVEMVELGPFERDHAAILVKPGGVRSGPPPRSDVRAETRGFQPRDRDERRGPPPRSYEDRDPPRGGGGGGFRPGGGDRRPGGGGGFRPGGGDDRRPSSGKPGGFGPKKDRRDRR